jgi:gamma-aminobutyric acid type B receptor
LFIHFFYFIEEGQPVDGSPIFVISPYSIVLKIFAYTWSSVGIVFAFACLIFNIVFRNKKLIRLTSPNLNYFIIFGAILLYSISFFTLIESDNDDFLLFSCITNVWAVSLGISFCFSPILAKMLRIYRIFRNPKANKKVLTDWHLFIIVVVIEGIVILLLVIGTAIPQVRPIVELSPDLERQVVVNESGFEIRYLGVNCYHIGSLVWVAIIAVFIGLLETIAVILATLTRQVEVKAVNDSKEVVAVVYIVTACSIALLVVTVALQSFSNVSDGFYLACILSGTTSAIGLMFIPKMWSLYKDPHGENVFEQPSIKSSGSVLQSQLHRQDSERIETLQREVGTLKKRLNSMRLASVQEVTETDCVTETEETDSNGINHHPGDDVFSPPETPSTDSNKTLAV